MTSDAVAEEISWLTTVLLSAGTFMFAVPAASAIEAGGAGGEMARTVMAALILLATVQYGIHLVQYNEIVRQGVDNLYKLLSRGGPQR